MKLFMLYLVGVLIGAAIEWALVCGAVYILSLCFDFAFDLLVATGVWILYVIARNIIKQFKK